MEKASPYNGVFSVFFADGIQRLIQFLLFGNWDGFGGGSGAGGLKPCHIKKV